MWMLTHRSHARGVSLDNSVPWLLRLFISSSSFFSFFFSSGSWLFLTPPHCMHMEFVGWILLWFLWLDLYFSSFLFFSGEGMINVSSSLVRVHVARLDRSGSS